LIAALGLLSYAAYKWYASARAESQSATCRHHLEKIGIALLNYRQRHGAFPPARTYDQKGVPINGWRAEVIPYFWYNFRPGRDDFDGAQAYDYLEPWNGPKNKNLQLDKHPCVEFQCPSDSHKAPAITNYLAVVGPNTVWSDDESLQQTIVDSDNDKILVIEVINSDILWMEPRDLTLEQALNVIQSKNGISVGSHHPDGIHYLTVGGKVKTLPHDIDRESLRKRMVRDSNVSTSR
jgi:hypothetical protein